MNTNSAILVAAVRNEGPWLLEWILYHKLIGFDDILIFSNDNDDHGDILLDRLAALGLIRHVSTTDHIPEDQSPQEFAYQSAMRSDYVRSFRWVCVLDADEFLCFKRHARLPDFLRDHEWCSVIYINWFLMGSGHRFRRGPEPVIQRFTKGIANPFIKTLAKTQVIAGWKDPHLPELRVENTVFTRQVPAHGNSGEAASHYIYQPDRAIVQVNHYVVKSLEEFLIKRGRARGAASIGGIRRGAVESQRDLLFFVAHDWNGIEDTTLAGRYGALVGEAMRGFVERFQIGGILRGIETRYVEKVRQAIAAAGIDPGIPCGQTSPSALILKRELGDQVDDGLLACFDGDWYLRRYPDVAAAYIHPLLHYALYGCQEGREWRSL